MLPSLSLELLSLSESDSELLSDSLELLLLDPLLESPGARVLDCGPTRLLGPWEREGRRENTQRKTLKNHGVLGARLFASLPLLQLKGEGSSTLCYYV